MTSFTYFPAVSDVNVILSEVLFSHVMIHVVKRTHGICKSFIQEIELRFSWALRLLQEHFIYIIEPCKTVLKRSFKVESCKKKPLTRDFSLLYICCNYLLEKSEWMSYFQTFGHLFIYHMSHVMRKPVFGVCNTVRLKPVCSAPVTS